MRNLVLPDKLVGGLQSSVHLCRTEAFAAGHSLGSHVTHAPAVPAPWLQRLHNIPHIQIMEA